MIIYFPKLSCWTCNKDQEVKSAKDIYGAIHNGFIVSELQIATTGLTPIIFGWCNKKCKCENIIDRGIIHAKSII